MFDKARLEAALAAYKQDFVQRQWGNERYKWEAVKCFQEHWDIDATDFADMLTRSLAKTANLLASVNNYPAGMLKDFAKAAPEEVRAMFINLFDERLDVFARMEAFKQKAAFLQEKYQPHAKQHFQRENAISTYLWLRYPDKYYIYKWSEVKTVAEVLCSSYHFKKGAYAENIRNFYRFYDELDDALKQDTELVHLFRGQLTDDCYPDPELRTLTIDVGFYISRFFSAAQTKQASKDAWIPQDYTSTLSAEDWLSLLHDETVFTPDSLTIMKRMLDYGGMATCKQLSVKYGNTSNYYNTGASSLARRVAAKRGIDEVAIYPGQLRWWPILFTGREAESDEDGAFVWRLRDELSAALNQFDLSSVALYEHPDPGEEVHQHWWLNANPRIWSFSALKVGEVQSYTLFNENGNKRRIYQNFLDAKAGDLLICYESNPAKQVVAIGRICAEQDGEKITFEKTEGLAMPIDYQTLRECPELAKMEYFQNPQGSLFRLTPGEYDTILDIIRETNPLPLDAPTTAYTKADFLSEVYMDESRYDTLSAVLHHKKNIILQGAPGVGKTFAAKRLAYAMMGEKDEDRIEFVQFHQNYSYEDFVMGYRPTPEGFKLENGVFYRFCQKAANHPEKDYFFIIDEINRGNMSKIFGELLMLIERDYRGTKATLAYNGLPFAVPERLCIIGMMNTADRSLAMIDYALRRRFSFFEIAPGFDTEGFCRYQESLHSETLNLLITRVKELNTEIAQDRSLGKGFCIGHSYFCGCTECTDAWLQEVVEYDLLPMLGEYWFDEPAKLQRWENLLRGVFQ